MASPKNPRQFIEQVIREVPRQALLDVLFQEYKTCPDPDAFVRGALRIIVDDRISLPRKSP
jgi:hypothetical protein